VKVESPVANCYLSMKNFRKWEMQKWTVGLTEAISIRYILILSERTEVSFVVKSGKFTN
jgi:hypothetical protein